MTKPSSRLSGIYDVDLTGDSLANLTGPLALRIDTSDVDGLRLTRGIARLRFDRGVLVVENLRVNGPAGVLQAKGVLGLTRSTGLDSLSVSADIDSLGGPHFRATQL